MMFDLKTYHKTKNALKYKEAMKNNLLCLTFLLLYMLYKKVWSAFAVGHEEKSHQRKAGVK